MVNKKDSLYLKLYVGWLVIMTIVVFNAYYQWQETLVKYFPESMWIMFAIVFGLVIMDKLLDIRFGR
mgnify:CR=1 FL=1